MNIIGGVAASVLSMFSGGDVDYASLAKSDCIELGGHWYVESYCIDRYGSTINGAAMNVSASVAWWRLPFQAVFIGLAYWHSKV